AAFTVGLAALVEVGLAGLFGSFAALGFTLEESGQMLALVLGASLLGMLVFDLHEGVAIVVTDSDLELLRRGPVGPGALLAIKLADALPRTSSMTVVLVLPALIAFARVWSLPLTGWALFPIQIAALWAIPLGLGVVLALQLLRLVPARRAREGLGLVWTL